MKRFTGFLLLACAAIAASLPSLAGASAFQATEISTLDMISGPAGALLIEFQNTGLVIDDVADSSFTSYSNGVSTTYTGYPAIVEAILDGAAAASAGTLTSSSRASFLKTPSTAIRTPSTLPLAGPTTTTSSYRRSAASR